jgi:hypothetical protein
MKTVRILEKTHRTLTATVGTHASNRQTKAYDGLLKEKEVHDKELRRKR